VLSPTKELPGITSSLPAALFTRTMDPYEDSIYGTCAAVEPCTRLGLKRVCHLVLLLVRFGILQRKLRDIMN
jgi:hypothetical protein